MIDADRAAIRVSRQMVATRDEVCLWMDNQTKPTLA